MFLDSCGEYINTNEYGSVLDAQGVMRNALTTPNNVGGILFSREEYYYSMNQDNLALKDNPKEENLRGRCLFQ
jgi:hypothetical protein